MRLELKIVLLLLMSSTAHVLPASAQSDDPLFASIRKAGAAKVALASNPPYQFVSPTGEATGSGVDLQNMVLKAMGLPALAPAFTDWNAMIPGLQAQQFDFVGAGLSITAERCGAVIFSAPFYATQTGLFVRPGNPKQLTSLADVASHSEIKIATVGRDSHEAFALRQGVKADQILHVPDIQAGVSTVRGGRADALVVGQFAIPDPKEKGVEVIVDEQSPVNGSGIAFRKRDAHFRDSFNEQLIALLRNGTLEKLYEKYHIPNGRPQAQLLAKLSKASDVVPSCE